MSESVKRILVLCLVFGAAFSAVHIIRAWQAGQPIFGFSTRSSDGQFAPEHATLETKPALDPALVPGLMRANDEMIELVKRVTPAVVSIDTEMVRRERLIDPFRGRVYERDRVTPSLGSGVIVSQEGHVITNHHVIEGQQRIRVTLHDGRSLPATLINSDKLLDIAVLRIRGENQDERFTALKFANSEEVQVGQLAIAVGNPFGLGETVTTGRISARDRSISDGQRDLFQTDAAINPGNSGGPLLNHLGEIIAINVAIYSRDRENPGFQGIGFSIPSNEVRRTMEHILQKGRPIRGYLGVATRDLNDYLRSVFNFKGEGVVILEVVPSGPADLAGLKPYDIITKFQDEKVESTTSFLNRVQRAEVGSEATISIWRVNELLEMQATVGEADLNGPTEQLSVGGRLASDQAILRAIGIAVRDLPRQFHKQGGVLVSQIDLSGLGATAGIEPNDLILEINGLAIKNAQDFYLRLVATAAVKETELRIIRNQQDLRKTIPSIPRTD